MSDLGNTQFFRVPQEQKLGVEEILEKVYEALAEKGYNPVNQIVGYIMSGDPTYITSYKNARSLIMKVERDELIEETVIKMWFWNGIIANIVSNNPIEITNIPADKFLMLLYTTV